MFIFSRAGQYPEKYRDEQRIFKLHEHRILFLFGLLIAFIFIPLIGSDYLFNAILIPYLVLALAGLGLNILTGYTGQLSLGSAAFMAVGAFATYNLELRVPYLPLLVSIFLGGLIAALFGILVGLPSLRIRGFYLIVSTLATQFFIPWLFTQYSWFTNHNASGVITAPKMDILGYSINTPVGHYLLTFTIVVILTILARNLINSQYGRNFRAVRDMETAAITLGIPVARTKLLAFAVSSFYLGIAGALWAFAYLGTIEADGLDLNRSFQILFIIIIGGLGSLAGSFYGAAFIVLLPIALSVLGQVLLGQAIDQALLQNLQKIIFGSLIIYFLIKEPEGISRLLRNFYQRLRTWPLRY
ncbi:MULTISPECIES: branched-chain amino acid ABC transporter permease [Acinetobacter calcoaceticus/baumannii complex]|uniref:branched-chain amino acid ABC transporter permease n=1 Tax=Acinetobacter calcoaceticus/baumannii complex TaxID=909768 RepID=UPI0023809A75|nr:branched-chain amino acid ABC transporter permease [Acinetobacter pittii]MDE4040181.1 branched-chain amino acid ABC transporter permease [Acinetobacter pittii]